MHKYNLRSNKSNLDDNSVAKPGITPTQKQEDFIKSTRRRTDELRTDVIIVQIQVVLISLCDQI